MKLGQNVHIRAKEVNNKTDKKMNKQIDSQLKQDELTQGMSENVSQ